MKSRILAPPTPFSHLLADGASTTTLSFPDAEIHMHTLMTPFFLLTDSLSSKISSESALEKLTAAANLLLWRTPPTGWLPIKAAPGIYPEHGLGVCEALGENRSLLLMVDWEQLGRRTNAAIHGRGGSALEQRIARWSEAGQNHPSFAGMIRMGAEGRSWQVFSAEYVPKRVAAFGLVGRGVQDLDADDVARLCAASGWDRASVYIDRERDDGTLERGEMDRLLQDAEAGKVEVLFLEIGRLAEEEKERLDAAGVHLISFVVD